MSCQKTCRDVSSLFEIEALIADVVAGISRCTPDIVPRLDKYLHRRWPRRALFGYNDFWLVQHLRASIFISHR